MTKQTPTLEEPRRTAYQAVTDHQHDMKTDPAYRREVNRIERKATMRALKKSMAIARMTAKHGDKR